MIDVFFNMSPFYKISNSANWSYFRSLQQKDSAQQHPQQDPPQWGEQWGDPPLLVHHVKQHQPGHKLNHRQGPPLDWIIKLPQEGSLLLAQPIGNQDFSVLILRDLLLKEMVHWNLFSILIKYIHFTVDQLNFLFFSLLDDKIQSYLIDRWQQNWNSKAFLKKLGRLWLAYTEA